MKKNLHNAHRFALYFHDLSSAIKGFSRGNEFKILQDDLFARITRVLRLQPGESVILFDQYCNAEVILQSFSKKDVACVINKIDANTILNPAIHFLLPMLKREALAQAVYALAEIGVQEIHLINTQKTAHDWQQKDLQRLQRIVIAAAEQSKNFAFPVIHEPVSLQGALENCNKIHAQKLFFDPKGIAASLYLPKLSALIQPIFLLIGPEGDLTAQEKELVAAEFTFCALTPTILRACQAAAVSSGLVRSWLLSK